MTVIERLRREKNLSQTEAAEKAGISVMSWSAAERGRFLNFRSFMKIAQVLPELRDVKLGELFNFNM